MKKQSRKRQRQLEKELFGPMPREREARERRKALQQRPSPPGTPGACWACGNCCYPSGEAWTCNTCGVTYPPDTASASCPACGTVSAWQRVECTPEHTLRAHRCQCGKKWSVTWPPHPPEFFQVPE